MIMGIIILKKSYRLDKYFSVGMITLGIIICTIISGSNVVSRVRFDLKIIKIADILIFLVGYE